MIPRPWTRTRRLCAGLQLGAVAALTLVAPVLLPSHAVFAHDARRATASTPTPPKAKPPAVELEGTLDILHEDREDGTSQYHHVLATDDGTRWALEGVPLGHDLLSGDRVRVKGHRSATALRLQAASREASAPAALQVLAVAPLSNTLGPQKTLVLLVNFSTDPSQPFTAADVRSSFDWVSDFFVDNSYQQTSLVTDVFGWYTLPMSATSCDYLQIRSLAQQAALGHGIPLGQYARQVYLFPKSAGCPWSGLASIGGSPSSAWINGSRQPVVIAHELGHNFGLRHSHALNCGGVALDPSCEAREYGDAFDTMGTGAGAHVNAFQKERLGWLNYLASPPITLVQTSATVTLTPYAAQDSTSKALRIPRGTTGQSFYVEFRAKLGWDAGLPWPGVVIHLATDGDPESSFLLDMTPETSDAWQDALLGVGKSFTDPVSGVTITTLSVTSASATVTVAMSADAPCLRAAPRVTASPGQSLAVPAGTAVTYTVSVTNTDSAACAPASFALQATAPTGWLKTFGASSVITPPGATAFTTLQITSPSVPTGSYTIVSAATTTTASPLSGSASMLYTVAPTGPPPPPPPGPAFTDTFDRPDSPVLGNGWSVLAGSLLLQSGEARNPSTSTFSLAVQPALIGATQTVAASFASTNNNTAPRFGVVVRYRDPQNYYLCYRQVGGSSVLRIAKIQNGVETVLTSVGIGNPALNAFSRLACQASGTTLTLQIDGVTKLSTSNTAFSTGSVGYTISTKPGGAHRADTFTAIVQ